MSNTTTEPRIWRLHLGAHKTATTHFQAVLGAVSEELEAQGVGVVVPLTFRKKRLLDLGVRRPKVWIGRGVLRRDLEARVTASGTTLQPTMVFSEEEILGHAQAPLDPGFYPRADFRVKALASALLGPARRAPNQGGLWISVRRLDGFLSAAYSTALKHMVLPFNAEEFKQRVLAQPPDWSDFISRIARAAPGVPITVWDYADYRANSAAIFSDVTGVKLDRLPKIPDPVTTQTPDAETIKAAERLTELTGRKERADRIGALYQASSGPRFAMFSESEAEHLHKLHDAQVERIHAIPGVRFLTF